MNSLESKICIRSLLTYRDLNKIRKILEDEAVFKSHEIEVALELAEDNIVKGSNSEYSFLVAEYEGELAGYVCYGPIPVTNRRFDLYWIAVRKDLHRKKIGSVLLFSAEKDIKNLGGKTVFIETSSSEKYRGTRRFYIKHKYREVARIPGFYNDCDDKLVYMKKL